jgi:hypothetical protein
MARPKRNALEPAPLEQVPLNPQVGTVSDVTEDAEMRLPTPMTEAERLEATRAAVLVRMSDIDQEVFTLNQERDDLARQLDSVQRQLEKPDGPHSNQVAIQAAIERSGQIRAQRAARVQQLVALGVDPSELAQMTSSPLDSAIAMRNLQKYPKRPQFNRAA